jgi:hypothetical protein
MVPTPSPYLFIYFIKLFVYLLIYKYFLGDTNGTNPLQKGIPTSSFYCPMMTHTFHYHPSSSSNLKGCIVCINVGLVGTYRREGNPFLSLLYWYLYVYTPKKEPI